MIRLSLDRHSIQLRINRLASLSLSLSSFCEFEPGLQFLRSIPAIEIKGLRCSWSFFRGKIIIIRGF